MNKKQFILCIFFVFGYVLGIIIGVNLPEEKYIWEGRCIQACLPEKNLGILNAECICRNKRILITEEPK